MKNNDLIYSFPHCLYHVFHFKCSDVPFNKEDFFTIEDFSKAIDEPFELYEKYIRAIEVEKRICYISVEALSKEFPEPLDDYLLGIVQNDCIFKTFVGEYDDEMKQKIEAYINEMGYSKYIRQESFLEHIPGFRNTPYSCNISDTEHTLGFYFSRHGFLRDCFTEDYPYEEAEQSLKGNKKDFEEIGKHFDIDTIKYLYGSTGLAHIQDYYQKHFIDNFEYGKSILFIEQM